MYLGVEEMFCQKKIDGCLLVAALDIDIKPMSEVDFTVLACIFDTILSFRI